MESGFEAGNQKVTVERDKTNDVPVIVDLNSSHPTPSSYAAISSLLLLIKLSN